jgi:Zn-dependent protease
VGFLERWLWFPVEHFPFVFLAIVFAFTLHEFAHAFVADKFGDPTPRSMGRVTLNPRVHMDLLGTILIFLIGFGWARPVLVNRASFKKPRLMGIIVSLVGPLANLFLVVLAVLAFDILWQSNFFSGTNKGLIQAVGYFIDYSIKINITLFLFNLLPLPPLDGYRILQDLVSAKSRLKLQQYEQWAIYIFLLFVFLPPLYNLFLGPYFSLGRPILQFINYLFSFYFGHMPYQIMV